MPKLLFEPYPSLIPSDLPRWFHHAVDVADLHCRKIADQSPDTWAALIADCWQSTERVLRKLEYSRGLSPRRRGIIARAVISSKSLAVAAVYRTLKQLRIEVAAAGTWSYEQVTRSALGLDMWAPLYGPVAMSMQDGRQGKQRPIFRLTHPLDIARHQIARRVQQCLQSPHPRQFATRGSGGDRAFKTCLRTHLPSAKVVLVADVPSCFLSLRKALVEDDLLLPRRVTRGLLTRPNLDASVDSVARDQWVRPSRTRSNGRGSSMWVSYPYWHALGAGLCPDTFDGEYGVLPGLPLAASAAEVCLAPVMEAVEASAPGVVVILWVDDFIILVPRAEDEQTVRLAFSQAIRDAICEPSLIKLCQGIQRNDPHLGFSALGYRIKLRGAEVEFAPQEGYGARLCDRLFEEISAYPERFTQQVLQRRISGSFQRFEGATVVNQALEVHATVGPILDPAAEPPAACGIHGRLHIYTDGSCAGSPGPGGWSAIFVSPPKGAAPMAQEIMSGTSPLTTSSEMELTAVVTALSTRPDNERVTVLSDSSYVVDNANNNLAQWKTNGWKTTLGTPIANRALWKKLWTELRRIDVRLMWVKGHSGDVYNTLADMLAKRAMSEVAKKQAALLA